MHAYAWVKMSRNIIQVLFNLIHRMVRENKWVDAQGFVYHNAFASILLFTHDIMVTQYKFERSTVEMLDQFAEHLPLGVVMTMEQVAKANEPCRTCRLDEVDDHFQISVVCFRRDRDARSAKMINLPQVKVGKKEDAFASPENRLLRVKLQRFAEYIRLQHAAIY